MSTSEMYEQEKHTARTESKPFESVLPRDHPISRFRFVFIGGLHRSGTTLLFRILRDHPMVSGFRIPGGAEREHEGQFHQSVYPPGVKTGGPGYFCLNPASAIDEHSDLATAENAERVFSEWSRLWDLSKPYLLEKSPPNLVRNRFLQRLFPNAYFITIVRHPVAVALATIKWMGWPRFLLTPERPDDEDTPYDIRRSSKADNQLFHDSERLYMESMLYTLFEHWTLGHSRYEEDSDFLHRFLTLRYEDLVRNPSGVLGSIYRFLDLPDPGSGPGNDVSDQNEGYFHQWESTSPAVLSPACRRLLSNRFADYFARFGYGLDDVRSVASNPVATPSLHPVLHT